MDISLRRCRKILSSAGALAISFLAPVSAQSDEGSPRITHGVAIGEVSAGSAVIWSRADRDASMVVEVDLDPAFASPHTARVEAGADTDWTAQALIAGLEPASRYHFRVWFETEGKRSAVDGGTFRSAPAANDARPIRFVWSGDLGGQNYCRHVDHGYRIFDAMADLDPHFFVANGDMIYADNGCPAVGPEPGWRNLPGEFLGVGSQDLDWNDFAGLREAFLGHWRYNRADPAFLAFNRHVPMIVQWDDHEVINDFGASWSGWSRDQSREGYGNLVRAGLTSFFDFHPFARHPDQEFRIYRSFSWGSEVDLFILDARSYRSPNTLVDDPAGEKTMLGRDQLDWLLEALRASSATWKIVSSDVPLAIPTGSQAELYGSDAFAAGDRDPASSRTGFQRELDTIVARLDADDVENVVFITTDVHLAAQFRYDIDADGDGDSVVFHELVSGPLNAGRSPALTRLDATLRPTVLYAEGDIFNFGFVRTELRADGAHLLVDIRDDLGHIRPGSRLDLAPE